MPVSEGSRKALTYSSYLEIERLLDLQRPLSEGPEHDEMLFIVIHQVYELWFKQVIHEVRLLMAALEENKTVSAMATLKRILTIFKTLVAQVDILETMSPVSFGSFRNRLESASGFQSVQFRELEFLLGNKSAAMARHHPAASEGGKRLRELLHAPTLYDSLLRFLAAQGHPVPRELLERDLGEPPVASPMLQDVLVGIYRSDSLAHMVCELFVDLDEGLQEWRYRHAKMVERTIGGKSGTGGSEGAAYLQTTLFRPLFPDLWAIRTAL